jgi:hypothetical protein
MYPDQRVTAERILDELSLRRMKRDAEALSRFYRYSGSEQAEMAVDYIMDELKNAEVPAKRLSYEVYRSLPITSTITILKPCQVAIDAIAVVYSGNADAMRGELVFDRLSLRKDLTRKENRERYSSFAGKIVLTYDDSFQFYYETARRGARAIISIWPKDIPHHDTMGGVWGTPGYRDRDLYPFLPYVEVTESDGQKLLASLKQGEATVQMDVTMDNRIVRTSMPIATVSGKSENFVLLSGHYDSWFNGMTDNGAANVLMLEIARILNRHRDGLKRSIVIAWWSGHSDGRYSGSTWYCDNNWQYLHDHCVAHINMDICGCRGSNAVRLVMTGMEGSRFNDEFLRPYNRRTPIPYGALNRSCDQSFMGVRVPVSIVPHSFVDDESVPQSPQPRSYCETPSAPPSFGPNGPFFWWHTKYDTLDKVSDEVLMRDCRIAAQLTCRYVDADTLPIDMAGFLAEMKGYFTEISIGLNNDFDLSPVFPAMDRAKDAIDRLLTAMEGRIDTDDILMRVAGELVRLKFTYSSPYYHDRAVDHPPYCAFMQAVGVTRENTSEDEYLFIRTDFVRQRNRMVGQLTWVAEQIDHQLLKWRLKG